MAVYAYRARDLHGSLITGKVEAEGEEILKKQLSDQGLIPISVRKGAAPFKFSGKLFFEGRIKQEEILVFTRQFQTLFKAGLGMDAILTALIRQCQNKHLKEVLEKIRADVSGGSSLTKAFSKHPKVFREFYVNMLAAGEEAGILEETLVHLSHLLEREYETRNSVKSATLYPKIVVGVLFLASAVLLTFVVPKFAVFYGKFGAALPLPTLILMKTSEIVTHFWYLLLTGMAGAYWGFRRFSHTVRGRMQLGNLAFRFPVVGVLNLRVANARFCHILSALYRSGLPMTRALEITSGTIENAVFRQEIDLVRFELTRGRSLSEGMSQCRYFVPVVVEATAAGEKSGSLDEMLEKIGEHYDLEISHTVKNLSTLLEPILLLLIFGLVGLFALAIFMPVWNMSTLVGQ